MGVLYTVLLGYIIEHFRNLGSLLHELCAPLLQEK